MKREEIVSLCDAAKQRLGSDYKVSKALDIPQTILSDWRHGRRNPQPEDIGLLADLAGMDGATWVLRAVVEKHEGTAKGDRLMKAVGKAFLAIGAGTVSAGANAQAISGWTGETAGLMLALLYTMYRKVKLSTQFAYTILQQPPTQAVFFA